MMKFSMNAESGWATTSSIHSIVYLRSKGRKGESGVVLTDVFMKTLGFWCRLGEKIGKLLGWGGNSWELYISVAATHQKQWARVTAS